MKTAKYSLKASRRSLSAGSKRLAKPAALPQLSRVPQISLSGLGNVPQPTLLSLAVYSALAALAVGSVTSQTTAWAQQTPADVLAPARLTGSASLQEHLPVAVRDALPTFVRSESMESRDRTRSTFEGDVELRRHDLVIRADRMEFDQQTGESSASGNVVINRGGDRFTGPELKLNVENSTGSFAEPQFELLKNGALGDASRVEFLDRDNMLVEDGRYSTCERVPGSKWMPDWMIRATSINLDTKEDVGTARGSVLEFKGVPLLAAPYFTFPLSDKRKSGVMPPTLNIDSQSGVEVAVPYYFNLAPNRDATLTPTVMSKRGLELAGEYRYLEPSYKGSLTASMMPSDLLRDEDRWAYSLQHFHSLTGPVGGGSGIGLGLNLNRVSDDNYWRDFPRSLTSLTSRLIGSEASLTWGKGPWSVVGGAYFWQSLQDPEASFAPPYDRLPSVGATYRQEGQTILGSPNWDVSFTGEYTRFERTLVRQSDSVQSGGDRVSSVAEMTRRWQAPGWYVQPKARLHASYYNTFNAAGEAKVSASRVVPTGSIDSGMLFERPANYFGQDYTQTLEPRAFLTWTPFRDQSDLPNYDSSARDFNLASMYSESVFNGTDRISDTRALTLGLRSRLINPDTGTEVVRLGFAQRYYLADQKVTLPDGEALTERFSDLLLSARFQADPLWSFDANVQFSPETDKSERTTLGARYTPGPYRALSAAYRVQRGESEQVEFSWQWPLAGLMGGTTTPQPGRALGPEQWYGVGRINYSFPDKKILDLVAGFEYDAGCWLGRVVLERLQTSQSDATQRVLLQLEFNGFSRLGASSLRTLQNNIPRYRYLRDEVVPTSRFPRYD